MFNDDKIEKLNQKITYLQNRVDSLSQVLRGAKIIKSGTYDLWDVHPDAGKDALLREYLGVCEVSEPPKTYLRKKK